MSSMRPEHRTVDRAALARDPAHMRPLANLALAAAALVACVSPAEPGETNSPDTVLLRGWTVHIGPDLSREPELRGPVLELLEAKLREVDTRLPSEVVTRLRQVPFRMHLDRKGCPGGVYHPSAEWLADHDLDPAWAGGIEFGHARNFLSWVHTQPSFVMHELTHAWHHQVLGYDHTGLLSAYTEAKDQGIYAEVLYVHGERKPAYALNNVQEYFAEASEAWWGTNDFYPFVRAELIEHDPRLAQLLAEVWAGLPASGEEQGRAPR
ncbi:MAG: hypothetical protein CMK00_03710 [Planctomycetes bacterium]|nr:hypothetical protein [Planctomycetota bacterium]